MSKMSSGKHKNSLRQGLEPSVQSRLCIAEKSEVGKFSSSNSRIPRRQDRRPTTPNRLPPINLTSVIKSDRRATKKTNNEFNLNPSRVLPDIKSRTSGATTRTNNESSKIFNPRNSVLPDIKSHIKAATISRRTSCHQTIHYNPQDEPEHDKRASLTETTKKYQKNKIYGTASWRQDVKSTKTKETTKSATRGKTLITKRCTHKTTKKGGVLPANKVLSDIEEERASSLDPILELLEFDGDVIYRSETQLGEAGSEYDSVTETPRPASPVDYSFKTLLSLDPNRKVPSRIPQLTGDLSKLIPPRDPVYPHPLRYFAGELIQKEYQKAERLQPAQQNMDNNNNGTYQEISPRRPLDAFEQTMVELKRPSAAYSKLSFKRKQPDGTSAEPQFEGESVLHKPHLHRMASRPKPTRTIDTSKADWWIKELDICRKACQELHKEVPGCPSAVSCSGDRQITADVDTTNAEQKSTSSLDEASHPKIRLTPSSDAGGSRSSESSINSRLSTTLPKLSIPNKYFRSDTAHPHISSDEESEVMFRDHPGIDLVHPSSTDFLSISLDPDLLSCSWLSEELIEEDFILRQISEHAYPSSHSGNGSYSPEKLYTSCSGQKQLLCRQKSASTSRINTPTRPVS